jgi:hypothetical protein
MLPTHLTHRGLHINAGLMRARLGPPRQVRQPIQSCGVVPLRPGVHGLTRHSPLGGHPNHRLPRLHRQHCSIPLLDDRQIQKRQSRPPQHPARKQTCHSEADHGRCQASGGTEVPSMSQDRTCSHGRCHGRPLPSLALYDSRRRSAPLARPSGQACGPPSAPTPPGAPRGWPLRWRTPSTAERQTSAEAPAKARSGASGCLRADPDRASGCHAADVLLRQTEASAVSRRSEAAAGLRVGAKAASGRLAPVQDVSYALAASELSRASARVR